MSWMFHNSIILVERRDKDECWGDRGSRAMCNGPKPCYLMYRYVQKNSLEKGRIDSMASDEFRACPRDQVTSGHLTSRWFCE